MHIQTFSTPKPTYSLPSCHAGLFECLWEGQGSYTKGRLGQDLCQLHVPEFILKQNNIFLNSPLPICLTPNIHLQLSDMFGDTESHSVRPQA